ncbi:nitrate reductase (quinol-dependent), catalytic subunit [Bryocella elongata]|uniref:Nitrate reductase (Quinol-dependent), catalytic subunit n=1 Tax=Bryocella elongata TaxID=863522 RepID=A0A1H6CCX3_9BACT|nr:molybdopterin-dependent oxidoreductase [Bryocella elongata]SEG70216.1 nitrate reductase (quinol-dependent), catalytic subunit [Bryocella elongata]
MSFIAKKNTATQRANATSEERIALAKPTLLQRITRWLGLDNKSSLYRYAHDPRFGYISESRVADKWTKTTCGYCSVGCGMLVGTKDGKPVAARGNPDHPVNLGKLCPKGLSEHLIVEAPGRAKQPMLRRNGRTSPLEPVSWDEALDVMVSRIGSIQQEHGRESLGVISTGQLLTEEFYTLGKLVQLGFRTSNYDGNTTLCMASAVSGYKLSFGSDGPPGAYADMESADVVLLIGANIADNHPILCNRLRKRPGQLLIVVDPRVTKTAMMADMHLPVKPRSDIALINGIAHILLRDGLIDRSYLAHHADGLDDFISFVADYTPEAVSKTTGLSVAVLESVASLYGHAKSAFIGWTMGVNHSTQGAMTVAAINNLSLLTGNIGRPGGAPFSITGQCNAMGSREASFTSSLPGYRKFESEEDRNQLAALWNVAPNDLPTRRGFAYPDIVEASVRGEVKALWIIATNPVVSFPNHNLLKQAFDSAEFIVVQDGFYPTPTMEYADLVLPAAIWGEKEGTYTNSERRVSKVNAFAVPPGEARADFDIFVAIAERLGVRDRIYPGWTSTHDAWLEWQRVSAGRMCDYSGFTWQQVEDAGGIQWGGERLYRDGIFPRANGRALLHCVPCIPFAEQPDAEFNFILNTGRTVEHWHTRTKTGQVKLLDAMVPNAWLEMNPIDAERLSLRQHDRITVTSRRASVPDVELRITGIVAPGQVFMPFHFAEHNSNLVTLGDFDPISREPNYKQCAVRIERTSWN